MINISNGKRVIQMRNWKKKLGKKKTEENAKGNPINSGNRGLTKSHSEKKRRKKIPK
jgi:hypothetical protein